MRRRARLPRAGTIRGLAIAGVLIAVLAVAGCARTQRSPLALVPGSTVTLQASDIDLEQFSTALSRHRAALAADLAAGEDRPHAFGAASVAASELLRVQEELAGLTQQAPSADELVRRTLERFELHRFAGQNGRGDVLLTGYYLPELAASDHPDDTHRFPLYGIPTDLHQVDLGVFSSDLAGKRITYRVLADGTIAPYHERSAIDSGNALAGRGLEIAWVDDAISRFFLMIQGSGILRYAGGTTRNVNYAAQNGRPYEAIGKLLIREGRIAREDMSMQAIRRYLSAHPEEQERIFATNPSYVFFTLADGGPYGASQVALTPGVSLAVDRKVVPQGTVVLAALPILRFDAAGAIAAVGQVLRLMIVQDTGGAIRGPGRADIYFGSGAEAEQHAGHLRHDGQLYALRLPRAP
ncbi:MAG: MltA domain-containing protein [Candidatus Schekmanbacteria bacterium]|nr:MltA domain-containing protein [Candidatus Schekmanbacteria bacterium]